jgi:predicted SAM-dependent methyltransferase
MARFVANKLSVKIYKEQFAELKTAERFSCIHMSHVIEHVPHPNDWLRKARELLMPDGILVINVPNMFSFSRIVKLLLKRIGVRKGTWGSAWRTPDHLFEPTISSMLFFLKKGGFEVLSIYSYSRSNMISQGIGGLLFHRLFKSGSNIRVYARPI